MATREGMDAARKAQERKLIEAFSTSADMSIP
jgi:hypothetical protein